MQRKFLLLLCLLAFLALPSLAQNRPDISSFTTSAANVGREALQNRTARIPVSWTTANRPLTANLVFEQIFPDGSKINVELPRLIPWVNSNGDGVAAPILPRGDARQIVLRVSLVSVFTWQVLDSAEIVLPIVDGNTGAGTSRVPTITGFSSSAANIDPLALSNSTARIPVSWSVINRPLASQLYFEQVLSIGTVVNVELPRPFSWVNSSDSGIVAPIADGSATSITLRLRLVDLLYNRVLDQRFITIAVQSRQTNVQILGFTSSSQNISLSSLQAGTARVDVAWIVENRPNNSNLVFEQVLPDGRTRNAELPRDFVLVSSIGQGVVAPIMPTGNPPYLIFQLRVVDLGSQETLATARLEIPIAYSASGYVTVVGDACYRAPFAPSQNVLVGGQGRVQFFNNGASMTVYSNLEMTAISGNLSTGTVFTIKGAPHCQYFQDGQTMVSRRRWPIDANGIQGWLDEYNGDATYGFTYHFVPVGSSDIPNVQIVSFSISPDNVDAAALNTTRVTFRWTTANARRVYLSGVPTGYEDLPASGEITVLASELQATSNPQNFTLSAYDSQQNGAYHDVQLRFNSSVAIRNFTVSNANPQANSQITFNWDIAGDFDSAYIWYSSSLARPTIDTITQISSNTGSYTFTLPDGIAGSRQITLSVTDESGTAQTSVLNINVACAYSWGMNISDGDCPRSAVISRTSAYQSFQRGFMVWLPAETPNLWVFYNDGTIMRYEDTWDGSAYTISPAAPDGLITPERGFGYLWNNTPEVRSGLGWGTSGEQSYTAQYQQSLSQGRYDDHRWYISLPDGRIVKVTYHSMQSGLTWE